MKKNYYLIAFSIILGWPALSHAQTLPSDESVRLYPEASRSQSANVKSSVGQGKFRTVIAPARYLDMENTLKTHARRHVPADKQAILFCDCKIEYFLAESPNRTTYSLTTKSGRPIKSYMVTVWRYKIDGASVNFKNAVINSNVNGAPANFTFVKAAASDAGVFKLSWDKDPEGSNSVFVEILANLADYSDKNKAEASAVLQTDAEYLDSKL